MATTDEPAWGVTVAEVAALASHADLKPGSVTDPEFGNAVTRSVTSLDTKRWIENVAADVDLRLHRRSQLTAEPQAKIVKAAKTVILNGAASYLVDAAYPARAGVNDNSSYGAVLWNRYKTGLEELVELIDEWIAKDKEEEEENAEGSLGISSFFPEPKFPDDLKW